MFVRTFRRGLKLPTRKQATKGKPIEQVPPPKQVIIPINQHFGAPNEPIVKAGDKVVRGHKIADAVSLGSMTVPIHASISGIVKKIEPRCQANNSEGLCIIIESDGTETEEFMTPMDAFTCTKEEALARVREAGILGLGGAGFPSFVKLTPPANKKIDLIIANGAECEPYLTTDEAAMTSQPHMLVKGLEIAMKFTDVKKAIIGIESHNKHLVPMIERELRLRENPSLGDISVAVCRARYPQGGERMLITALSGREVPSGGLPMDAGCIVQNTGTLIAIAEAFVLGKPLIDRTFTVTGGACKTPKNINAPVGTILKDLPPEFLDVDYSRLVKIVFGGPMMGFAVSTLEAPVQKNTSGVLLLTKEETIAEDEGPCIRCGRCIKRCPCRVSPVIMNSSLEAGDLDLAVKAGLLDCMECGSCAFMCPARIKLVQRFRVGKQRFKLRNVK